MRGGRGRVGPRNTRTPRVQRPRLAPVPRTRMTRPQPGSTTAVFRGARAQRPPRTLASFAPSMPQMSAPRATETVITHREFLRDITGSTTFALNHLPINPGIPGTFPWLAAIARNFEQYHFERLVFTYRSTSATAVSSTNTALGVVVLATQYDMSDSLFTNKQSMEAYEGAVSTNPSLSVTHVVDVAPRHSTLSRLFVRDEANIGDTRFYDLGSFSVATAGMQAAATIGELWVDYTVRLYKPKLAALSSTPVFHVAEFPQAAASSAYPLGLSGGTVRANSGFFWDPSTLRASFALAGNYLFTITQVGTYGNAAATTLVGVGAGIVNHSIFRWNAVAGINATNAATTSVSVHMFTVTDTSSAAVGINQQAGYSGGNTDIMGVYVGINIAAAAAMTGAEEKETAVLVPRDGPSSAQRGERWFR
jgi:hypothetical protein